MTQKHSDVLETLETIIYILLEKANTFKQCLDILLEYEHDIESKAIHICWSKEQYEKIEDVIRFPGIITYAGDYVDDTSVKVSKDLSNHKTKLRKHLETQAQKYCTEST